MQKEEILIDEKNFSNYFREVNNNKPDKGEIIASYRAKAYFVKGDLKKDVINLLKTSNKIDFAINLLVKSAHCLYEDAINISKNICKDLSFGLTDEEILDKEYPYTLEIFYYAKEENVPKDDKHWSIMKIIN